MFQSKLVGATLPYKVVLPTSYNTREPELVRRFPVLYLLHGLSGHYDNWLAKTNLTEVAARYNFIIVTPEGNDGWYTDSATVTADRYESYFMQELIPEIDHRYRTIEASSGRAVAGLSMGGYGALKFGLKYPERFAFAASMSGALDAPARTDAEPGFAWNFLRASIMQTFGPKESPVRAANDLYRIARSLSSERLNSLPFFYLDCGTEDGFFQTSRELAALFLERKIPHEFRELPGRHDWDYWGSQAREVLRVAAQKMPSGGGPVLVRQRPEERGTGNRRQGDGRSLGVSGA